jgi:hypothetical protein
VEESDGIHFLTMQLVEGLPLDRLIGIWRRPQPTAAYGQLGQRDEAGKAVQQLPQLKPNIALIARPALQMRFDPELVEHLIDSLRKAGLEIGTASG